MSTEISFEPQNGPIVCALSSSGPEPGWVHPGCKRPAQRPGRTGALECEHDQTPAVPLYLFAVLSPLELVRHEQAAPIGERHTPCNITAPYHRVCHWVDDRFLRDAMDNYLDTNSSRSSVLAVLNSVWLCACRHVMFFEPHKSCGVLFFIIFRLY